MGIELVKASIIDIVKDSHYADINYRYELFPYPVEIFVPIKGFSNYEISSYGRILSLGKSWNTGNNIITKKAKIKKPNISKGYYMTTIFHNCKGKVVRIHQLVAEHFLTGPQNENINHEDGFKLNNCYKNLTWMTVQQNVTHAINNGLVDNRGERQTNSKLTSTEVFRIREIARTGLSKRLIAVQFGVSRETIQSIYRRRTWTHI
jgi:hypothetical protein